MNRMQSKAVTVNDYLASLGTKDREMIELVRNEILKCLPVGYVEKMQYGMIGYVVPLEVFPEGYLDDPKVPLSYVCLAAQKNYVSVYMMHVYADKNLLEWFLDRYKRTGKRLDMGKSCLRFRRLEDIPVELIGETVSKVSVERFISAYKESRKETNYGNRRKKN